jgi:HK97 gp10 family phage protein
MKSTRTELAGLQETREAMAEFTKGVQRNVGRRALLVPAHIIGANAQSRAPVSTRPDDPTPGSLRGSFQIGRGKGRQQMAVARVAILFIDPAAVPIEYGTTKMAAQPFFRPAIDAKTPEAIAAFETILVQEVNKAAAKAAKKSKGKGA